MCDDFVWEDTGFRWVGGAVVLDSAVFNVSQWPMRVQHRYAY